MSYNKYIGLKNWLKMMKPTTIYLPEETEASLQELANKTGKSLPELIEEVINNYLSQKPVKLPKSVGMGASGRTDLSSKTEQLLWTEE
ncbi:MAG: CopG family transcriptional regulator [Crocosphaera sp.]|nr:CopG family transcriptional regulator [Crocosphaera sp.]